MATSFRCAAVGCYSYESQSTHKLFQELQSYLNRFARAVGFAPLVVDGILGTSTVNAAQKVALAMVRSGAGPQVVGTATPMITVASTPQTLASGAEPFVSFLKLAAQAAQLPAVAAPAPVMVSTPTGPAAAIPDLPGYPPQKKLNKVYVAAGAIFGIALLFGGYQLVKNQL